MIRVMVVDDMSIFREPIAASLRASGYETTVADDGQEALGILAHWRPDLILLDVAMPVMDGIAFLTIVRGDPATRDIPIIMLTAMSDKEGIVKAARLGVREYLLKSKFSLRDLLDRVKKHVGAAERAAPVPTLPASFRPSVASAPGDCLHPLTREECQARLAAANDIKSLTRTVAQVQQAADSPLIDAIHLAELIGHDPVLASKVVQIANSVAYVTSGGPVNTIADAVRRVGCVVIRDIALAVGMFDAAADLELPGFPRNCFLRHSLAVAALCKRLAATEENQAVAYLMGICHDLGELLFFRAFGGEYQRILDLKLSSASLRLETERRVFGGASKRELQIQLLKNFGLPHKISQPILEFHDYELSRAEHASGTVHLLRMAEAFANGLLLHSSPDAKLVAITRDAAGAATDNAEPPLPERERFRSEILDLTALLTQQTSQYECGSNSPLLARHDRRVLLVRSPELSSYDPIHCALESLANVTVAEALPITCGDCDGMVVLAPDSNQRGFSELEILQCRARGCAVPKPTLWIVGQRPSAPDPTTQLHADHWPISLSTIGSFVAGLRAAEAH